MRAALVDARRRRPLPARPRCLGRRSARCSPHEPSSGNDGHPARPARPVPLAARGGQPARQHRHRGHRRRRPADRLRARLPDLAAVHRRVLRRRTASWGSTAPSSSATGCSPSCWSRSRSLCFLAALGARHRRATRLSLVIGLGIPLQAVIGGITVLTDLNPWIVAGHFLLSMAMIMVCVALLDELRSPDRACCSPAAAQAGLGDAGLRLGGALPRHRRHRRRPARRRHRLAPQRPRPGHRVPGTRRSRSTSSWR